MTSESGAGYAYTYGFDGNGNTILKSDGLDSTVYSYDYENRLSVASEVDGLATTYLLDKNRYYAQVLEEYENSLAAGSGLAWQLLQPMQSNYCHFRRTQIDGF